MSMYPFPPAAQPYYGQQFGASTSYQQFPQQQAFPVNNYPAPPQPPISYVDPASFRRDFSQRLAELTVNSRPIIQNLSMMAQDYARFGEIVGQCLEAHIRRIPPWMKLPSFYLLDMISKNIYEPYARHFARFVVPLFVETYQQVDEPTRSKMVELVLTWRTGSPTGKELFGVPAQVSIERSIWGDGSRNPRATLQGQITAAQVLSELEFTLGAKERALQVNPADAIAQNHVAVLQQLRMLVEAGVSQQELHQILSQLRSLMRPPQPTVAPPQSQTSWPAPSLPASFPTSSSASSSLPSAPAPPIIPKLEPSTSPSVPAAPTTGFADLLSSLLKSGVVSSSNGTPVGAGSTVTEQGVDYEREAARSYRTTILEQDVQLSTVGLTRTQPAIRSLLYEHLSLHCKQCGVRFLDNDNGKKEMEEHMDMHFRQNLKANQNIGRGHTRSWFIGVEDWTHDVSDVKGKRRANRPTNVKAAAAAEARKREEELRSQFVVVPPGDESKTISCPICKEILGPEFVEDDEEWVWKNAVMKDERIYHATCHAEASSSILTKLRTDVSSRSGTPERTHIRGASASPEAKLVGVKRKLEDDDPSLSEQENTPRLKRLALAPPP